MDLCQLSQNGYIPHIDPIVFKGCVVLFSPMLSDWMGMQSGGRQEKSCRGYISEMAWCGKLSFGRDIGFRLYVCNSMV